MPFICSKEIRATPAWWECQHLPRIFFWDYSWFSTAAPSFEAFRKRTVFCLLLHQTKGTAFSLLCCLSAFFYSNPILRFVPGDKDADNSQSNYQFLTVTFFSVLSCSFFPTDDYLIVWTIERDETPRSTVSSACVCPNVLAFPPGGYAKLELMPLNERRIKEGWRQTHFSLCSLKKQGLHRRGNNPVFCLKQSPMTWVRGHTVGEVRDFSPVFCLFVFYFYPR